MNRLFCFVLGLMIITACNISAEKNEAEKPGLLSDSSDVKPALIAEDVEPKKVKTENQVWVDEHIDKDFLLGKVKRTEHPLFVKVGTEHTERNIYLIQPVYEAYKKMHEAALSDGVELKITSGHRTFMEQVIEWELRWKNPRTDESFPSDIEKARYVLRYRSMPGTSRHHWGTDIDLNSFHLSYFETPEGKKMYKWLSENAATYGFYQSYTPLNKKRPTGYQEEKWHWSYKPLAQYMLIKYLELVSVDDIRGFKGDKAVKVLPVISEWVCGINPEINDSGSLMALD